MARRRRCLQAGGCYHVINRGNDRATLFRTAADYALFMALLQQAQARLPLPMLAFALMPNHVHLVVVPNHRQDVSTWMKWLLTTHACRHHLRRQSSGHVWQGRFKAFPVEPGAHLLTVLRYVERNPVRARLVRRSIDWPWCSAAWRHSSDRDGILLDAASVALPADWTQMLERPEDDDELVRLRACVNDQRPFGTDAWIAGHVGEPPRRSTGRPRGPRVPESGSDPDQENLNGGLTPISPAGP